MLRNNKGVTLVELLIVIVILGIIAAIAVPAVGNIVENAQDDAFIADATTVRNAASTFCQTATSGERDVYCTVDGAGDTDQLLITNEELDPLIEGLDATFYVLFEGEGNYTVFITDDERYFVGDPREADRNNVVPTEPDEWDSSSSVELPVSTPEPDEPEQN